LDLHDIAARACVEYCRGWIGTVLDSGVIRPGICCAGADVLLLRGASRGDIPLPFWVVGATADIDVGLLERPIRVMGEIHGGAPLHVRHCVARTRDPSRPIGVLALRELMDTCLEIIRVAHVAGAEMDVTAQDGETTLRLRIAGLGGRR
jgi:hypothetical protein